jgi:prevent-host-death family protein
MRVVNVHQAKTHLSPLIDEAHAGETIVLAKAGKPWARLMPLAPPAPQRLPGRLRNRGPLSQPNVLLEPMDLGELEGWESNPWPLSGVAHDEFLKARAQFSTEDWIDVQMQSVGYNP